MESVGLDHPALLYAAGIVYNLASFHRLLNRPSRKGETAMEFVSVAKLGEIPEGRGESFVVGEHLVAVFNVGGQHLAINDLCLHMGASLAEGDVHEGVVSCPWHGWRFRLCDGAWCDNPRIKTETFPVRIVHDQIQIGLP